MNTVTIPSAYTTSHLFGLQNKSIKTGNELEKLLLLSKDDYFINPVANIFALVGDAPSVGVFLHPILHLPQNENKSHPNLDKLLTFIDCRAYYNPKGSNPIRNYSEYSFIVKRAMMDSAWVKDKLSFRPQFEYVVDTFSTWATTHLRRTTNAPELLTTQWKIVFAIYYYSLLLSDAPTHHDGLISFLTKRIGLMLNLPAALIDDLFSVYEEKLITLFENQIENNVNYQKHLPLNILGECLTTVAGDTMQITPTILYNVLSPTATTNSNKSQITGVALEHPPTFMLLMYFAGARGFASNTGLGITIKNLLRRHDVKAFELQLGNLTKFEP